MTTHVFQERALAAHSMYPLGGDPQAEQLAGELSRRADFDAPIRDFEAGNTWLRDISLYTENERAAVLALGNRGPGPLTQDQYDLLHKSADALHTGMTSQLDALQPYAGWNFLVNAGGFINAGYPWARGLDNGFKAEFGRGVNDITANIRDKQHAHQWVAQVAGNRTHTYRVGYYLAGRSAVSEAHQEQLYGQDLAKAKRAATAQLHRLAPLMGLAPANAARAQRQIALTRFSSFDHLLGGVTSGPDNIAGDYVPGTFRVEVKFAGNPGNASAAERPGHVLQHEVNHAGSAQDTGSRAGLWISSQEDRQPNETMTEFLAQDALHYPDVTLRPDGSAVIHPSAHYQHGLAAMLSTRIYKPEDFATLYKAYYGQVDDPRKLSAAITSFRRTLAAARHRNS